VLFLPGITKEPAMQSTSVTSKGQVTIPKQLRQRLGLRQGSKVEFVLIGDRVELRIVSTPADLPASGFGMLKSKRVAVAADFDPASLLARGKTGRRK
jgi:AbrB family looped-hinge helix DNA binding protein